MKSLITITLLFLTIKGFSQEHSIDSKRDTSFSFTLSSECINAMDYTGSEGISNIFINGDSQIFELTIIKNCGQTTELTVSSLIDSIVITRIDTGEAATCQCFQKCTLTVDNIIDSIAFNMFGSNKYISKPIWEAVTPNHKSAEIDFYYHNKMVNIIGDVNEPLKIRMINQVGQVVYNKVFKGNSIIIPSKMNGLFICEIKGDQKIIRKKIYIN